MRVTKNCINCNNEFLTGFYSERSKYCSRKCLSLHKKVVNKVKTREVKKAQTLLKRLAKAKGDREWELKKITEANKAIAFLKNDDGTHKFGENILTLKNYKEPLTQIPRDKGIGWFGVLAADVTTGKIQCHLCGQFFDGLPGHIWKTHKTKTRDYREAFGLSYTTALVSEPERMKLKTKTLEWLKAMTPEEKEAFRAHQRERSRLGHLKRGKQGPYIKSAESMNKDGSCPDQTLQAIIDAKNEIGHVPSKNEFIQLKGSQRYVHLAYKHFGSWKKAIEMCHFSEKRDVIKKGHRVKPYTREELLEYLRIYAHEYQQIPTASDWKRDLLPSYDTYSQHFESIEEARREAGVYDIVSPNKKFLSRSKHYRDEYKKTL